MPVADTSSLRRSDPALRLFGREPECRAIDDMLDAARAGRSTALLLWGEPGIGKSALLRYAEHAEGIRVLTARGIETEAELAFSGLSEILRPILDRLPSLPDRQARALAGALAIGPPTGADPLAIGAATLGLLAAASTDSPLLVVVDDLQWLDASSRDALLFAARRLRDEPVALLLAMRDEGRADPSSYGIAVRFVGGLDAAASHQLLASCAPTLAASDTADRLVRQSGGNPLALMELPGLLAHATAGGASDLGDPLIPLSERLQRTFAARASILPPKTRTCLLLIAANDDADVDPVRRALAPLGLASHDLEDAEASGLLVGDGTRLEFRHPLIRAAVYHEAEPAVVRAVHRALADAVLEPGTDAAARRAWHLATAALGEDDEVAATLEEAAVSARHRGGFAASARMYERAARLTSSNEERARRVLAAAEAWQLANGSGHAMDLLDEALRLTSDRLLRADLEHQRALVNTWRGPALEASRELRATAEALRDVAPGRAAAMLADATLAGITGGDIISALATAERAQEIATRVGGPTAVLASLQLGKARILTGDVAGGYPLLMHAVDRLSRGDIDETGDELAQAGPVLLAIEEYAVAEETLARAIAAQRAASAMGRLAYSLGAMSELEMRIGRWAAAAANGAEAVELAREAGQSGQLSYNLARLARLDAAQGRPDDCQSKVSEALVLAERFNFGSALPFAHSAVGLLHLGLGHLPEAILALDETKRRWFEIGLRDPGRLEWQADLVEALIRTGERALAETELADLERRAEACRRPSIDGRPPTACTLARAAAARCRGLIADPSDADEIFGAALGWHAWSNTPFERARTELCYGEQLRRHGRRVDARGHLRAALATFEHLGADPWSDRARKELAATGETVAPRKHRPLPALTPQELQVALLVGAGSTNREVGAALFLTPKTVEFHLAKVYRKLELRSRTELANWLARNSNGEAGVSIPAEDDGTP